MYKVQTLSSNRHELTLPSWPKTFCSSFLYVYTF